MKRFNNFSSVKSNTTSSACVCSGTSFVANANMLALDVAVLAASIFMLHIINIININIIISIILLISLFVIIKRDSLLRLLNS